MAELFPKGYVSMLNPDSGEYRWIPEGEAELALQEGYVPEAEEQYKQRKLSEAEAREYDKKNLQASAAGLARGLTFGLSDPALVALGADKEHLQKLEEHNPIISTGTEIAGTVGTFAIPGGPAAKLLGAAGKAGVAASKGSKIAEAAVREGILGGTIGAAGLVSDATIGEGPLTADEAVARVIASAALGGTIGAAGAGIGKVARSALDKVRPGKTAKAGSTVERGDSMTGPYEPMGYQAPKAKTEIVDPVDRLKATAQSKPIPKTEVDQPGYMTEVNPLAMEENLFNAQTMADPQFIKTSADPDFVKQFWNTRRDKFLQNRVEKQYAKDAAVNEQDSVVARYLNENADNPVEAAILKPRKKTADTKLFHEARLKQLNEADRLGDVIEDLNIEINRAWVSGDKKLHQKLTNERMKLRSKRSNLRRKIINVDNDYFAGKGLKDIRKDAKVARAELESASVSGVDDQTLATMNIKAINADAKAALANQAGATALSEAGVKSSIAGKLLKSPGAILKVFNMHPVGAVRWLIRAKGAMAAGGMLLGGKAPEGGEAGVGLMLSAAVNPKVFPAIAGDVIADGIRALMGKENSDDEDFETGSELAKMNTDKLANSLSLSLSNTASPELEEIAMQKTIGTVNYLKGISPGKSLEDTGEVEKSEFVKLYRTAMSPAFLEKSFADKDLSRAQVEAAESSYPETLDAYRKAVRAIMNEATIKGHKYSDEERYQASILLDDDTMAPKQYDAARMNIIQNMYSEEPQESKRNKSVKFSKQHMTALQRAEKGDF